MHCDVDIYLQINIFKRLSNLFPTYVRYMVKSLLLLSHWRVCESHLARTATIGGCNSLKRTPFVFIILAPSTLADDTLRNELGKFRGFYNDTEILSLCVYIYLFLFCSQRHDTPQAQLAIPPVDVRMLDQLFLVCGL